MTTWPSIFPKPTQAYSIAAPGGTLRTQMDTGYTRQRQRGTIMPNLVSISWDFDDETYTLFSQWHKEKLGNGSDDFLISLALGSAFRSQQARFVGGTFDATYVPHARWLVTAKLEVQNPVTMMPGVLDAVLDEEFLAAFPALELAINDELLILTYETFPELLN